MSKETNFKGLIPLSIIAFAAIAGFIASQFYFSDKDQVKNFNSLLVYPESKAFSGFELTDHNGDKVKIDDFADQWTLIFFGFTHCPDVCPTTLAELKKAYKTLANRNITNAPKVLFVSVDPERDNNQTLKDYIHFFNPDFKAATGNDANLLALTSQVGVAFHIGAHEAGDMNYTVDHTAAIFVVNPMKQLYGLFRTPHEANKIVEDLILLSQES